MAERTWVSTDLSHGGRWTSLRLAGRDLGDGSAEADCGSFSLRRLIIKGADVVSARYRLTAAPGYRFVWAAHALLDVSPRATLWLPGHPDVRLYPEAAVLFDQPWPAGAPFVTARWRNLGGFPDHCPYRSIGVEPMLGSVFDLAEARQPADAVTVPGAGRVEWELQIRAGEKV